MLRNIVLHSKIIHHSARILKQPEDTASIFALSECLRRLKSPLREQILREASIHPDFLALYHENYKPQLRIDELKRCSEGSFGAHLFQYFKSNDLALNFYPRIEASSLEDYLVMRLRQTHDLWHVLLDFNTSVTGEAGLQAFTLMQIKSPFSMILLFYSGLFCVFKKPDLFFEWINEVRRGVELSRNTLFLLNLRLEKYLREPLETLRRSIAVEEEANADAQSATELLLPKICKTPYSLGSPMTNSTGTRTSKTESSPFRE